VWGRRNLISIPAEFLVIVFSGELKRVLTHLSFLLLFALLLSLFVLVVSTYTLRALYLAVS
jgi:hypothetical protein